MNNLKNHILCKKYKKVYDLCLPLRKLYLVGFIYMRRYPDGRFIDLSNQIEWTSFFLTQYFEEKYPVEMVVNHMLADQGALLWCTEPENLVWKNGVDYFGFGNGISIYKQRENYCEIFCFYGKSDDLFLNKKFIQYYEILEKFIKYFLNNMTDDINYAYEMNDVLLTPDSYLNAKTETFPIIDEIEFLKAIEKKKAILSAREIECVAYCLSGKTAKEIAQQTKISARTVETYLANAKKKLACRNLKELLYTYSLQ